MTFKKISENFAVSPQITLDDVRVAAEQGYRTIICNRPDGEEAGQLTASTVAGATKAGGLAFAHVPVAPGAITATDVANMAAALRDLPGPTLAYCRSGARSSTLWDKVSAL